MNPHPIIKSKQQGVVLLEAMIAILIFSMGVLAIVGLQAAMLKNTTDSKFRTDANYIAQQRIGQMWADPANLAAYVQPPTAITDLPNGTLTTTQSGNQYTVTVTWQQPGQGQVQHSFTTTASITP
jgi:type IV pilus assembly protein PilV